MTGEGNETAARWTVSGLVQGVGFRWFVQRRGHQLGLVGWVRNLPSGQVEVVARGSPEGIRELEAHLRRGPPAAEVERVEKLDLPHERVDCKSFEIR